MLSKINQDFNHKALFLENEIENKKESLHYPSFSFDFKNSSGDCQAISKSDVFKKLSKKPKNECLNLIPDIWSRFYEIYKGEEKKVKIDWVYGMQNQRNLLYIIKNNKNVYLIGKTQTSLSDRFSVYLSNINKLTPKLFFHRQVKANPTQFRISILYYVKEGEDIDALEAEFIKHYCELGRKVYNSNKGGGGGRAGELPSHYAVPVQGLFDNQAYSSFVLAKNKIKFVAHSHFLEYFNRNKELAAKDGKVFGAIYSIERHYTKRSIQKKKLLDQLQEPTPSSTLLQESLLNKRMRESSENSCPNRGLECHKVSIVESPKVKRYIGLSGVPKNRISIHCSLTNGIKKQQELDIKLDKENLSNELYRDLINHVEEFRVGILPIRYINPAAASKEELAAYTFHNKLGEAETQAIETALKLGEVYNKCKKGGGGPRSRNLCQPPLTLSQQLFPAKMNR